MTPSTDIEFHDMQAIVRFAHGHLPHSTFVFLSISNRLAAAHWLASAPVATAQADSVLPRRALQVALTATGLAKLGLPEQVMKEFSAPFSEGMSGSRNRSRRLGDTGHNAPQHWWWGASDDTRPDLMLMLYGEEVLDDWLNELQTSEYLRAFTPVYDPLHSCHPGAREPFGFADGISQPHLDWSRTPGMTRQASDRYTNATAPGELLLGYPNEYGLFTRRPLLDISENPAASALPRAQDQPRHADLGRNGSYLTFRQLEQDVEGFWGTLNELAEGTELSAVALAEAMVGRTMDGEPLCAAPGRSDPEDFTYAGDPNGVQCPLGAHIRRANPRTADYPEGVRSRFARLRQMLGFGQKPDLTSPSRFHRLWRRGRPYGPPPGTPPQAQDGAISERAGGQRSGLLFISLGADLSRQFEFVQSAWCMNPKFSGVVDEEDPLLGHRAPLADGSAINRFTRPQLCGPPQRLSPLPVFVRVRGGEYFFLPGLQALRYICAVASTSSPSS